MRVFFVQNFGAQNYKAEFWDWNFGAKNSKALLYKKRACKTLMKLTPYVHFTDLEKLSLVKFAYAGLIFGSS